MVGRIVFGSSPLRRGHLVYAQSKVRAQWTRFMMCYPAGLCFCSRNQAFTIPITCSQGLYAPQVGLKATPTVGLSTHLQESQKRFHHYKEKPPNNHLMTWSLLILFVRQNLTPHPHTGLSSLCSQEWSWEFLILWSVPLDTGITGIYHLLHLGGTGESNPGHCAWQASTLATELHPHMTACWCLSQCIHGYVDVGQSEGRNCRDKGLLEAHMGTGKTDSHSRQVYESENILDAFALLHSLVQWSEGISRGDSVPSDVLCATEEPGLCWGWVELAS